MTADRLRSRLEAAPTREVFERLRGENVDQLERLRAAERLIDELKTRPTLEDVNMRTDAIAGRTRLLQQELTETQGALVNADDRLKAVKKE